MYLLSNSTLRHKVQKGLHSIALGLVIVLFSCINVKAQPQTTNPTKIKCLACSSTPKSQPCTCAYAKDAVTREEFEALKAQLDDRVQIGQNHPGSLRLPGTETDLHFYGMFRGNALYDASTPGGGANYLYVYANAIPLKGSLDGNERGQFIASARESRIGFEAFNQTSWGDLSGHLEMDFLGYHPDAANPQVVTNTSNARWRLAYFHLGKVMVGQAPTNFFSLKEVPKSLDLAMGSGIGANRQTQIRYTDQAGECVTWSVSAEGPESEYMTQTGTKFFTNKPGSGGTQAINRLPDFVGKVDVTPFQDANIGTGLVLRQLSLKTQGGHQKKIAYGVGFNGHITMLKTTTLMWQLMGGNGIGRYILDAAGQGAFYNTSTGTFKTQKAYGGTISLEHQWTPSLSTTLIGGMTRILNDAILKGLTAAQVAGGVNKAMYSTHVNTIWSPFGETLDLGVGYTYAHRKVEDGRSGMSHRFIMSASYKFGAPSHKSSHLHLPDAG